MTDATVAPGAPLTGAKVLMMLLAFFAVVFAANGLMMYDAISTFRGETADHPYESGLKFNAELAAAAAQQERNWKVDVTLKDGVQAAFRDAQGRPVEGLAVTGKFAAPADRKLDRAFALAEIHPGVYAGKTMAQGGVWEFDIEARRGGEVLFQSHNRVTLP